jgi:myo-inositol 2-dehydrogenase/D-chiro-inositol 1-dehydrogenase
VHGSGGMLRAQNHVRDHGAEARRAPASPSDPVLQLLPGALSPAYRAEMDTFVTGVLEGKPLAPTGEDGLKALLLADAAEESAKSGKSVKVG